MIGRAGQQKGKTVAGRVAHRPSVYERPTTSTLNEFAERYCAKLAA